jgi:methyl-accepting chemotaxis protein
MVLVMQTDFDAVAQELPTPADSVFSQVVDSQGRIVAGTQETSRLERNDGTLSQYIEEGGRADVVQSGLAGNSGFVQEAAKEDQLEDDFAVAYAPVPGTDWVVTTHVPTAYAFSLRSTITQSLLVLVGATLIGLAAIAVTFGRGTVSTLNRLTQKAQELESGNLDVELPVKRNDEFGTLTAAFASMRNGLTERIEEAEKARKEAEVARSEAVEMNNYLQAKADEYANILQQAAAGDLTSRLEQDGESEAMDQIASEFNAVIEELERTTGQLKSFSQEVESAGHDVQQSADVVRATSEDVVEDAMAVTQETENQRERLQNVAETISEATSDLEAYAETHDDPEIRETLDRIGEVATLLDETVSRSETVIEEAEDAAATAEEQAAELNEVSARAGDLVRYAGPLQEVLERFQTESEHEFYFPTGPGSETPVEGED